MCYYCGQTDTSLRLILLFYQWLGLPIGAIILYFFPLPNHFLLFNSMCQNCFCGSISFVELIIYMMPGLGFSIIMFSIIIWMATFWQFYLDKK